MTLILRVRYFFFRLKRLNRGAETSLAAWPLHHWPAGTLRRTASTWEPHPAQVVLPQTRHWTARHM
jgi:hypothetical protein